MNKMSRIKNLIIAAVMIVFAGVMLAWPQFGTPMIMLVVGLYLLFYGIYSLIFYFTMAIHMVDGKRVFYRGILLLDLGVFMLSAYRGSERLVFLYLMLMLAASGAIDLVRALDFRKQGESWKFRAVMGVVCILLLISAFIYRKEPTTLTYMYCIGMFVSAINRVVSAFRTTAIVYIP